MKISVIVPVYNVNKYIKECLLSILNQTYKNIEVLIIDDGGTDGSILTAQNVIKNDSRVKILSYGCNRGVSFARNYGLQYATGELIYFIDSDDFIELNYLESMINNFDNSCDFLENHNLIRYYNPNYFVAMKHKKQYGIFTNISKCQNFLFNSSCNKLYKRDFLINNSIKFPENMSMGEDWYFKMHCLCYAKKIKFIRGAKYFYRQSNSSTLKVYTKNSIGPFEFIKSIYTLFKENNALDKIQIPFNFLRHEIFDNTKFYEIQDFLRSIQSSILNKRSIYDRKNWLMFKFILNAKTLLHFRIIFFFRKAFLYF